MEGKFSFRNFEKVAKERIHQLQFVDSRHLSMFEEVVKYFFLGDGL